MLPFSCNDLISIDDIINMRPVSARIYIPDGDLINLTALKLGHLSCYHRGDKLVTPPSTLMIKRTGDHPLQAIRQVVIPEKNLTIHLTGCIRGHGPERITF